MSGPGCARRCENALVISFSLCVSTAFQCRTRPFSLCVSTAAQCIKRCHRPQQVVDLTRALEECEAGRPRPRPDPCVLGRCGAPQWHSFRQHVDQPSTHRTTGQTCSAGSGAGHLACGSLSRRCSRSRCEVIFRAGFAGRGGGPRATRATARTKTGRTSIFECRGGASSSSSSSSSSSLAE